MKAPHNGDVTPLVLSCFEDDPDLQMRVDVDENAISEMAEAMKDGEKFPPGEAIYDEELRKYYRTDGHRRCAAAILAGKKTFDFAITKGTRRDAILAACRSNIPHDKAGKPRTRADKRNAVSRLLSDSEWCKWSDNRIAEFVAVSVPFVGAVRKELEADASSVAHELKDSPRQCSDGKSRKKPQKRTKHGDDTLVQEEPNDELGETVVPPEFDDFAKEIRETIEEAGTAVDSDVDSVDAFYDPDETEALAEARGIGTDSGISFDVSELEHSETTEICKQWNSQVESFAKSILAVLKDAPEGPFMDSERKNSIKQLLDAAAGAVRAAKYFDKPCPRCDGHGNYRMKECKACRGVGAMPKHFYEMAGG